MTNSQRPRWHVYVLMFLSVVFNFSSRGSPLIGVRSISAQDNPIQGTVWVADEFGNSITVIDASTNEVLTTLTGIEGPHNLQVSPDGASVWAVSGHDSTAVVIDAQTYELIGTSPTGEHPAHIILTPDGSTAYVTNSEDNTVTAIDAATLTTVATIPVGEYPHGLRPSPDGRWIYVANTNGTTLSVIDSATNTAVADIEVGQRPVQVAFSPDGAVVYVSLNAENAVAKVDVATRTLVDTIEVGVGPIQVFVTPDNSTLLVANQGTEDSPSTTVSVIDITSFAVVNTIETGNGAHGVVTEPSGQYAYITNLYGNTVSVLDLVNQQVIVDVPTGSGPNGISFSPLPASPAPATGIALETHTESSEANDDQHTAHHSETEATPTPLPNTTANSEMDMGQMSGMDMVSMMQQMSDMMDMEMSEEMRTQMEQMQGMMDMMMSGEMMPGMDMMDDTATPVPMEGMNMGGGHSMEPISSVGVPPATESVGGQPLEYRLEDGVKVFDLTAEPVIWNILDDVAVTAWTYNGTVPGSMIRVTEGDRVRINFTNNLPEATTIHWHGITVPNAMDGVPGVTQEAIQPGETYIYEFNASPTGTFMYHSHFDSDVQVGIGLYAPFIIDPVQSNEPAPDVDVTLMLSEWRVTNGQTYPAMPMSGAEPNYFTINGHAFPSTETITVQRGHTVRLRLIGIGQFIHPMHLHGMPFDVVAIDGYPVLETARQTRDTLSMAPGERYDIEFVATETGTWLFHCHILHHVTNDGVEPGGLALVINVIE
ncbi:MAG: multicopper oxidase domain-containing protein [Chloroflexi bacterium]|nr:multicopper oxidase domain-containing protein [Chloroflexota bacterium]